MLPLTVRPARRHRARRVLGAWRMFRVRWMLRVIRFGRLVAALCVAHALDLVEKQPCTARSAPDQDGRGLRPRNPVLLAGEHAAGSPTTGMRWWWRA